VKYLDLSSKGRPSPHWIKFAAASLIVAAIAGCGGGGTGANTTVASNPAAVAKLAVAQWQALTPQIAASDIAVSIPADGKPVVSFKVTDSNGSPVIGLGGQQDGTSTALKNNYNLQFTLAKLIPANATTGAPSKWVNYGVTMPNVISGGVVSTWKGTFPRADTNGTLVDNNDGTYKYTFLRDITAVQAQVNALIDSGTNLKADLDAANLAYDAAATHRLGILIVGSQPGTGTNTPNKVQVTNPVPLLNTFNIGYDFVPNGAPVTVTRDIVVKNSCASCHDGKGIGHVSTTTATNGVPGGVFVGRNDPRLCVTCHTDQTKYSFVAVTESTPDALTGAYKRTVDGQSAFTFPRMIHQFHMGSSLTKTGYNLNGVCNDPADTSGISAALAAGYAIKEAAMCFNTVGFPQDVKNCALCHDGNTLKADGVTANANKTTDGNNWMSKPSIIACGACHDGINFATGAGTTAAQARVYQAAVTTYNAAKLAYDTAVANGTTLPTNPTVPVKPTGLGHAGGAAGTLDSTCATCHATGGSLTASFPASGQTTEVSLAHRSNFGTLNNFTPPAGVAKIAYSISSVTLNASRNAVITFKIAKTVNGTTSNITTLPVTATEFTGGPSLYVAYGVPQDGIAAPADFNISASASLASIAAATVNSTTTSSLASKTADANGYFTATLIGAANMTIPTNATIITGVMLGHFTQTAASSGQAAAIDIQSQLVMKPLDGTAGRRALVSTAKCNACHAQLGTSPYFHGGDRNDPQSCNICHNANRTSSGWSADSSTFVHGIHAANKRSVDFSWHAVDLDDNYSNLDYPGRLKNCNQCHLPNTVNFGISEAAVPNMLWSTTATGKFVGTSNLAVKNVTSYSYAATGGGTLPDGTTTTAAGVCVKTLGTATSANPKTQPALTVASMSPYVVKGIDTLSAPDYGWGFTTNFTAAATTTPTCSPSGVVLPVLAAGAVRQASPASLVNSPISSACFACHDTAANKLHFEAMGGAIYATRASVSDASGNLVVRESCLTCHGAGKAYDAAVVHQ